MAPLILLLNLSKDTDRLQAMTQQLGDLSLPFERVDAINGIAVPPWLRPYFLNDRGEIRSGLRAGEVGCASHLEAMRRIVASSKLGIVLEDDVAIAEDFHEIIEAIGNLPTGWDIVRLSNDYRRGFIPVKPLAGRYQSVKFSRIPGSSAAYLITPEAAARFLAWKTLRSCPIDYDLRQPWDCKLVTYGIYPQSVTHPENNSSIGLGNRWRRQRGWWGDFSGLKNNIARWVYNIQWLGVRESWKIAVRRR